MPIPRFLFIGLRCHPIIYIKLCILGQLRLLFWPPRILTYATFGGSLPDFNNNTVYLRFDEISMYCMYKWQSGISLGRRISGERGANPLPNRVTLIGYIRTACRLTPAFCGEHGETAIDLRRGKGVDLASQRSVQGSSQPESAVVSM